MHIAVLGATGQTGSDLVKQALSRGHKVTAIVRDEAKLRQVIGDENADNSNLVVSRANIFSGESLKEVLDGADIVICTLGFSRNVQPVVGYTDVTKAMVEALKDTPDKRMLLMHAWYTQPDSRKNAGWFLRTFFLGMLIGPVLDGMDRAEQYLTTEAKDAKYTIVLPAGLKNMPVTEKPFTVQEDSYFVKDVANWIARADVARFLLDTAEETDPKYIRKTVAITTEGIKI